MRLLARWVVLGRWWILGTASLLVIVAAILGAGVASELSAGGFDPPHSESTRANRALVARFPGAGDSDLVLVATAASGSVDDLGAARAGRALTDRLARSRGVERADSYWTLGDPLPLRSRSGRQALVIATLDGDLAAKVATARRLTPELATTDGPLRIQVTGVAEFARQVTDRSEQDLDRVELVTAPLTAVALVVVFGSVVAAALPLVVGLWAIVGTLLVLVALASITEVSVFALSLTTGLSLGLAIDYSLFVVSRYREELAAGAAIPVAVARTLQTAGRTVAVSAATVMISLLALLLFPQSYLRSFAYAGVPVVLLAALGAVVVLPALLVVLGPRVERRRVRRGGGDGSGTRKRRTTDFWDAQAKRVVRHPWPWALGITAVLLVLAVPFLSVYTGQIDDRVVPPEAASSRRAADDIRREFATRESGALRVYLPGTSPRDDTARIQDFARALAALPSVARVDAATGSYFPDGTGVTAAGSALSLRFFSASHPGDTWVNVVPSVEPSSRAGEALARAVRSMRGPGPFVVAGSAARLVDAKESITSRLPLALGLIAGVTVILLFLMTGSVIVPLKALFLNLLSLTAAFGAMVFVFQDGRFAGVLGYTPTGSIDTFTPILMFCIAFGLSMDYEVFLLSRIKEEYDLHHDNERAVASGLRKTGRIVTAAALVLMIVFVGLVTSDVVQVKLFGLGLALAVLVDAFLIRATLVPAFMSIAGRWNWWAPRPLRRFHLRFGVWESEPIKLLDRELPRSAQVRAATRAPTP